MKIIQSPSPNFSSSSYDKTVLMIHKTLGLMPWTLEWLQKPRAQASCQYIITKKGVIHQLVSDSDMSWHAGLIYNPSARGRRVMLKTNWGSYVNPNKYCIGIENEALINDEPTKEQLEANIWLFKKLRDDKKILFDGNEQNFITHRDTCSYKPNMEIWRNAILKGVLLSEEDEDSDHECKRIILDNWGQFGLETKNGKIILFKRS
jgi:N-acetyl-anhydromuramyl-L-alanine amidase AmpD